MAAEQLVLVASYTQPEAHVPTACGEGITTCGFNPATGQLARRSVFGEIVNPSYLAFDAAKRRVFAVSENLSGNGEVYQFYLGTDGKLSAVARQPSHGAATCHVAILPDDRVCASSYFGGCLDVYQVREGRLSPASRVFRYEGRGANAHRQGASHAHQAVVAPGGRWFYVCDFGADCVWRHDIAAEKTPVKIPLPPGHGPRHLVFHFILPRVYVLGELTGSVAVCDWDSATGALNVTATTHVLDKDADGAAIRVHPSNRALWVSLRQKRLLKVFCLDAGGMPIDEMDIPFSRGEPRDFAISPDGRWLISANQSANELVVIELDPASGLPTGRSPECYAVGTPVCILFCATK